MVTVFGGSSKDLAKKLAKKLDVTYVDSQLRVFADGENLLTISDKPKDKVIVVQSTNPPVDSNLIRALSLITKARQTSSQVIAVIPYLCYMRQDVEFLPNEIITSKVVAKLFKAAGTSEILTIDSHSDIATSYFDMPIKNISAIPKLAGFFKKMKLDNPLVVAPDLFWSNKAREFATILGTSHIALNKQRNRKTGKLHIITSKLNLFGRDVILIDDMISTGDSMIKAAEYLKNRNCGKIFAACTHGLLVNNAQKRLYKSGIKKIVCTNTIPGKNSIVDLSDILTNALSSSLKNKTPL